MRRSDIAQGMATIADVAHEAGVSTATAARALGGYGSVRESTRERVLQAAQTLNYRANGLARSMITGSTHTVGVLLSDIENPFFRRSLRGIGDTARHSGFEVLLANTDEQIEVERTSVSLLTERRVDGLIVCPADASERTHLTAVMDAGIPVVLLDRPLAGVAADTVGIDNREAARAATQHLLKLGHERIAILTGGTAENHRRLLRRDMRNVEHLTATTLGLRAAGYRDAMIASGLQLRPDFLSSNGFRREDAVLSTVQLLELKNPPTAVLSFDSVQSLGALQAFQELGVSCPDEISLLGFDDAEWTEVVSPPLSVVAQPAHEIGATACRLLLARIAGDGRKASHHTLPTVFMDRGSIGAPPAASRRER